MDGYWWYVFPDSMGYVKSWSLNDVLIKLVAPFKSQIQELKKLIKENNGVVSFDVNLYVEDRFPELSFEGEIMQIIHELSANISININKYDE